MKFNRKIVIILFIILICFLLSFDIILDNIDIYNYRYSDENFKELIDRVKIGDSLNVLYNREEYEGYQFYIGKLNTYNSIRKYAFYESKWYNKNNDLYLDPYDNQYISLEEAEYDHIIPLYYANSHGAYLWSDDEKANFANDPLVGVCTKSSNNRSKGIKGPSEWLPKANEEDYCYTWLVIADKYNLTISKNDMDTIIKIINDAVKKGEEITLINPYN